jgi:ATP-dependent DNA ligase
MLLRKKDCRIHGETTLVELGSQDLRMAGMGEKRGKHQDGERGREMPAFALAQHNGRMLSSSCFVRHPEKARSLALYSWVVPLPVFHPLTLDRKPAPFSHPDWLFEVKWDGFRALARIDHGRCRLLSRNGNEFKSFKSLSTCMVDGLQVESAILDGEIVCLDDQGKPQFADLLFRRGEPRFIAFDVLFCDGQGLRYTPLIERKQKLHAILPRHNERRIIYCDHVEAAGEQLFQLACENDLEGIVAKRKFDPYLPEHAKWIKIRNTSYSQWEGREELFERERETDPDISLWDGCVLACEDVL